MSEFHEDAIVLSGETGTRLKCQIVGEYYKLWWEITSGGPRRLHRFQTSLVEMNAGTGEDYIEERRETVLGSAGHALDLKATHPNSSSLKVILVEEDPRCYSHLKKVIHRRWPQLVYNETPYGQTDAGIFFFNQKPAEALQSIERLELGNSLFFFDPLLYTPRTEIERLARTRLLSYYQTGTEFIVFLFTSDWFLGRGELLPLPETEDEQNWKHGEKNTVLEVDSLFGHKNWRPSLLRRLSLETKMLKMVELYSQVLNRWFRYVLPLPFEPKAKQRYHLFICSNYEDGVRITWDFYANYTGNPRYSPDNKEAFSRFMSLEGDKVRRPMMGTRPEEWRILWKIVKSHFEGICDVECKDLQEVQSSPSLLNGDLKWLHSRGYLRLEDNLTDAWPNRPPIYRLNWAQVKTNLGVDPPLPLKPLRPKS